MSIVRACSDWMKLSQPSRSRAVPEAVIIGVIR